jgi:hypothetical protein
VVSLFFNSAHSRWARIRSLTHSFAAAHREQPPANSDESILVGRSHSSLLRSSPFAHSGLRSTRRWQSQLMHSFPAPAWIYALKSTHALCPDNLQIASIVCELDTFSQSNLRSTFCTTSHENGIATPRERMGGRESHLPPADVMDHLEQTARQLFPMPFLIESGSIEIPLWGICIHFTSCTSFS